MDRLKAKINLTGEFTASELEDIIRSLAEVRAALEPAVPTEAPSAGAEQEVLVQEEALFAIRTRASGGIRIWLRNEGIGWLAFELSAARRAELVEFLGKKLGHTHTAH